MRCRLRETTSVIVQVSAIDNALAALGSAMPKTRKPNPAAPAPRRAWKGANA